MCDANGGCEDLPTVPLPDSFQMRKREKLHTDTIKWKQMYNSKLWKKKEILSNTCKWLSADCLLMQYWAMDVMWTKDMGINSWAADQPNWVMEIKIH